MLSGNGAEDECQRRTPHATDLSQDSLDREPEAARVRLLGGFSVWVGSRILRQEEWRSKKASTLVKLLALAPGHRMHQGNLIQPLEGEGQLIDVCELLGAYDR